MAPNEPLPPQGTLGFRVQLYGIDQWKYLFTPRQTLVLATLCEKVKIVKDKLNSRHKDGLGEAVQIALALNVDKMADYGSSLSSWSSPASQETVRGTFSRQALPIVWDFAEAYPFANSSGGWMHNLEYLISPLKAESDTLLTQGHVESASAICHPLPDQSTDAFITDPPYYDAIPYADLSDFFIVWLNRSIGIPASNKDFPHLAPKEEECVVDEVKGHDRLFFESMMTKALAEGRRLSRPGGVGVVVFAHKSTAGWEAQLQAMIDAGWVVTASWPIDTEREGRMRANASAALASSVHLVCRPRENPDGSLREDIGDWRDVLQELPRRIHEWMPRLAQEGVVGADAIFACLGPALEIFSRYSRVEKASGEQISLKAYLEQVWSVVAKEAFNTIFEGADAAGFEEDARLTAIWFWVMKAAGNGKDEASTLQNGDSGYEDNRNEEDEQLVGKKLSHGYAMEYDDARMLAQGLGVNLQQLSQPGGIVVIKGNIATLYSVAERERYLLSHQLALFTGLPQERTKQKLEKQAIAKLKTVEQRQSDLFIQRRILESSSGQPFLPGLKPKDDSSSILERLLSNGSTVLDRLHQAMLLFARSHTALLRPFLVETQMATDQRFWRLAQALAALYPSGSDEKRWVEGMLARKKSLGF